MLRIRLSRTGKIRQPSYRVVVAEKDYKRDGRIVESIGHYNPLTNPAEFKIKEDRALYWLSVGAQPSDAVRILLNKQGTFDRLARLQAGESLDALVTEFTGVEPWAATVEPAAAQQVTSAIGGAVDAVAAPVAAAVEKVDDVVDTVVDKAQVAIETVVENIEEAVQAVIGADEEE